MSEPFDENTLETVLNQKTIKEHCTKALRRSASSCMKPAHSIRCTEPCTKADTHINLLRTKIVKAQSRILQSISDSGINHPNGTLTHGYSRPQRFMPASCPLPAGCPSVCLKLELYKPSARLKIVGATACDRVLW